MPLTNGGAITRDTAFDKVSISITYPGRMFSQRVFLYHGEDRIGSIKARDVADNPTFNESDPEVIECQRRLDAGEARLYFEHGQFAAPYELHPWSELQATLWYLATAFPFHERGVDPHHFFNALARGADHIPATERMPQRFHVPGIIDSAVCRYYKRDDGPATPAVSALSELADAGWTKDIPYGGHTLNAIDVLDTPEGVSVGDKYRVYHKRKDVTGAIVAVARAWHRYWRNLSSAEQGINVRMTMREHVEHAIGRLWADKPHARAISVFYEGDATASRRDARLAEDWMLGDQEQWAHHLGYAELALKLAGTGKRAALNSELDDNTFCHIKADGTVGDRLSNGTDGITQATWDAYQSTHYPAAVNHGVDGLSVESLTIIVERGSTEPAQVVVTGGLKPYTFTLTQTEMWASIDESTGVITAAPPATVAAQDYTLRVRVDDDLGTVENINVTVTVTVPTP